MRKKLLIIGFVWPEPKSSAAGVRMMQLINFFQKHNYNITFATACAKSDKAFDLSSIGVSATAIELNSKSFNHFVDELKPDIVLFDRFMTEEQFGWRVSERCPQAIKILDTEDLHFLRRARQQAFKNKSESTQDGLYSDTAKREIASIYRCDLSLIISKTEMDLLQETFKVPKTILHYLPFLVGTISEDHKKQFLTFDQRQHFMTIGNFLHEPNYDALLYLKETLWKSIKQRLPHAKFYNYGAYATQKVHQLHNENDGFLIKGFAQDVDEVMQNAKVLLAPIRFGAGLKGKLFDAMQNGLPFVTTTVGGEGILDESNDDVVNDTSEGFVNHAVKLYTEKNFWKLQQKLGFEILETQFPKEKLEHEFLNRLGEISIALKMHRQQNFIGQLLQHHTLQSTKYMSKWIEEKNTRK